IAFYIWFVRKTKNEKTLPTPRSPLPTPRSPLPAPHITFFLTGTAVALAPFLTLPTDTLLGRAGQVSILNPAINGGDLWGALARQTGAALGLFFWRGDAILRHNPAGRPLFDPLMLIPFLVGLGWCLRHWR
ncbi:MAG: hypothetical protein ACE5FD_08225, partial [Anaerolineae bacterium]